MTEPLPWQEDEIPHYMDKDRALLFEPGLGKSFVIVRTMAHWFRTEQLAAAIVFAPNGVHRNWVDQITEHMPPDIPVDVIVWDSSSMKIKGAVQRWIAGHAPEKLHILLVNIEAMSHAGPRAIIEQWMRFEGQRRGPVLLTLDEFHQVRNPASKRSRALWAMAKFATVRRILSGTPIPRGWENIYSPFRVLGWQYLGAPTFMAFKTEFCILKPMAVGGRSFTIIDGYKNIPELQRRIDTVSSRKTLDLAGLPPALGGITGTVPLVISLPMNEQQEAHYKALEQSALTLLADGLPILGDQAIALVARLQQITGGGLIRTGTDTIEWFGSPKVEATVQLAATSETPILVWSRYRHEVDQLAAALKAELPERSVFRHHGGISNLDRLMARNEWSKSSAGILVATAATLGTGFTLNEARLSIFYSNSFRYEERYQAERRNLRIGQGKSVSYWDISCKNTVDEHVLKVLRGRQDLQTLLMGSPSATLGSLLRNTDSMMVSP